MAAMRDRPDRTHVLRAATYPVMFIIGKEDITAPFPTYAAQIQLPKRVTVHVLEEVGHMGMFEAPTKTLKFVKDFCQQAVDLNKTS